MTGLDGSLKDGSGGAGWKLTVSTGILPSTEMQTGDATVDSVPEEKSSTRCKLQGISAWMATIEKLLGKCARGTIEAGYDSDADLKGINNGCIKIT